jgi:uncharacterized membrane protein
MDFIDVFDGTGYFFALPLVGLGLWFISADIVGRLNDLGIDS